jgi:hypothetical protein
MRTIKYILFLLISSSFFACTPEPDYAFWSPYQDINWQSIGHYDSEFHTHPGLGEEEYDPHQTIDRYHAEGYQILSISGHDYDIPSHHIQTLYPWTQLSDIYEIIKDVENPRASNRTYADIASEPYQNRDPVALNMVSVEGCEISAPHDIVSLFNPISVAAEDESKTLDLISEYGGLAYFAHPWRYVERRGLTAEWYVDLYRKHDVLLGQAIYNRQDRYPQERAFFDKIAHMLGRERPIWLYGDDDMHYETTLGWNRDVIMLENFRPGSLHPDIPDGSAPDVRQALKKGHSYLWKPSEQYNKRAFNLIGLFLDNQGIRLVIDNEDQVSEVRWRTHNPHTDDTETVHMGYSITLSDIPDYTRFVRAEIAGPRGTIYTQPFYVNNPVLNR